MEIEEMQLIWNSQNGEKLYAINEDTLYAQIRRKSQSVDRKLTMVDLIMIVVNLLVSGVLIVDAVVDTDSVYQFIFPALYLAYAVFAFIRRQARRKEVVQFEHTMLGELDKAIWGIDYLIRQAQSMIVWYLLPLVLIFAVYATLNDKPLWGAGLMIILLPASYFGVRWEVNKFYLPKKTALEALRETLITSQPDSAG